MVLPEELASVSTYLAGLDFMVWNAATLCQIVQDVSSSSHNPLFIVYSIFSFAG